MTRIVSFSALFKWDSCPRQFYYRFDLGLKPIEESPAMVTGTKGHRLLQSFYQALSEGFPKDKAIEMTKAMANRIMAEAAGADFNLLTAWTLVDNYIRDNDFTSRAYLVENRFLLPASKLTDDPYFEDVQIGFTPDVVFERTGGHLDVEDSKFVQRAWPKSKIERFPQAKLYQIFLNLMGYNVTRSTLRFFNVKTGKIDKQDYFLGKAEESTLTRDFMRAVKEVLEHMELDEQEKFLTRRTMNYTVCQFCAFEYPCTLQAEGKSAEKTLQHLYVKSDYDYAS